MATNIQYCQFSLFENLVTLPSKQQHVLSSNKYFTTNTYAKSSKYRSMAWRNTAVSPEP